MENQSLDEHCSEGSDITSEVCNDNNNSTDQASPVRQFTTANCEEQNEEPECVKRWAVEFQERLKKQEAEERKQIAQLEEQGINELRAWSAQYRELLAKALENSRLHNKELQLQNEQALASMAKHQANHDAGTSDLWERVCDLCNFNQATGTTPPVASAADAKKQNDVNRMRVLLLQLKHSPPVVSTASR